MAYGYLDDARRIAKAFVRTIDRNFARDANMREKYDVVKGYARGSSVAEGTKKM